MLDTLKSTRTLTFLEIDPEFSLSPSLLLARRKSETVLDFPVPPKNVSPANSHTSPPQYSPTPSTSSNSSVSSYPVTPMVSDSEDDSHAENNDRFPSTTSPSSIHRQPYRTPSALSLRSFGASEFDAQAAPIYALLRASPASPPPSAPLPKEPVRRREVKALRNISSSTIPEDWVDVDSEIIRIPRTPTSEVERKPSITLTVQDGLRKASIEIPFVIDGNFLEVNMSDEDNEDNEEIYDFDGIEFEIDGSDIAEVPALTMAGGFASSDEESDDERSSVPSPSRVQDPVVARQTSRRAAIAQPQFLVVPSAPTLSSPSSSHLQPAPAPSPAPSTQSSFLSRLAVPPRESIVPRDVNLDDMFSPVDDIRMSFPIPPSPKPTPPPKDRRSFASPVVFTSPFMSSQLFVDENDADDDEPGHPILRSRFSTSTLNSVPEHPQSPRLTITSPTKFFARLLGSPNPSSPTSKFAPPTPPKTPSRNSIQPLRYHKTLTAPKFPKTSPSPPARRPSKSLELYDRPPITPTSSSPIPFDKERTERYYQYYRKHQPGQRALSSTTKRFPSRSSLDTTYSMESATSGSGESVISSGSSSSTGLKRRPIPVELFIKH